MRTALLLSIVALVITSPANAADNTLRPEERLYVEAVLVEKSARCGLLPFQKVLPQLIISDDYAEILACLKDLRPAAELRERIMREFSDTPTALRVAGEPFASVADIDAAVNRLETRLSDAAAGDGSEPPQPIPPNSPELRAETDKSAPAPKPKVRLKPSTHHASPPVTRPMAEVLYRQLEGCWIVPVGAKGAQNLSVDIRVRLDQQGGVRNAEIVDRSRMARDPFFRAAAESALRAVYKCSPLRVSRGKYPEWQDMTLTFDPKDFVH